MTGSDRVWLLDSSALVNIKRTVPGNKQWTLLKQLERMVQAGSLAFPRQVKDEVTGMLHPDAPGVWADGVFCVACSTRRSLTSGTSVRS